MKYVYALALGFALSTHSFAQDGAWKDRQGKPIPATSARQSMNGFGGSLLVTPDAN